MAYAFYDPSEYDKGSTMPVVPDAIEAPGLEQRTGADWLLSPFDLSRAHTDTQIALHLTNGAQLVQMKRLGDFPASVGYRLNDSLARMQRLTQRAAQCALLVVGVYWPSGGSALWIGQVTRATNEPYKPYAYIKPYSATQTNYQAVVSAYNYWSLRGGVCLWPCPNMSDVPQYLIDQLVRLVECQHLPAKVVYPPKPTVPMQECEVDGLQLLVQASPTLKLLVAIPGIGIDLAQTIIMHYASEPGMSVLDMLAQLSSPAGNWPAKWGKGRANNLANALWIKPRPTDDKLKVVDHVDQVVC